MDIRNMRQLLAIQSHGSFAKAAQALGMSQPSLSAAIARLEDQLQVTLLERTAQGSHLTPIGELIAERASKVISEAEQIVRDAALAAGGEVGAVRVGIGTSLSHNFAPRLVRALATNFPALSLTIEMLERNRMLPMVKSRELDVIICALGDALEDPNLVATEVLRTHAVAVAHPSHPLVGEGRIPMARFAEFPSAGSGMRGFTNAAVLGLSPGKSRLLQYQANDYAPLLELALGGHATLLAPLFVVQPYLDDKRLERIDLDWRFPVSFAAIATRAASYSPIISRVIGHASAIGKALQEEAAPA
jgi:DNA-binding transcriptional LysR family regulator